MSYILDALRKSEQERQLAEGKSAGVLYPVAAVSRRSATPGLVIAGAVAFGLAAAAGAAYLLLRSQPPAPPAAAPAAIPAAQAASVPPPVQPPPAPLPQVPPVVKIEPPVREVVVQKPVAPVREVPPPPPVAKPEVAEPRMDDIPPISISGYIRDDEAGGMAMINDRLVREGEEVSPGLRLEKILPEGAVFNYKGRRFTR